MRDGGKGDTPRPIPDRKKFEQNWDLIFNKGKQNEPRDDSNRNVGSTDDSPNDVKGDQ